MILLPTPAFAQPDVRVFVAGSMTGPVKEAGAGFARSSGHTLVYVSDTTGALLKRLAAGETADLVVVTGPAMDTLQKENKVVAGSRVDLARALIGVGVCAGASSPDLSTPDTFKAALLAARSVAYLSPASGGTSGTYFEGLLQRMGLAKAMKAKTGSDDETPLIVESLARTDSRVVLQRRAAPRQGVGCSGWTAGGSRRSALHV